MYRSIPRELENIARLLHDNTHPETHPRIAQFGGLTRCVTSLTVLSAPSALRCNDFQEESPMALELLVPLSTEVIEQNPECVTGGACRDGVLVIDLHAFNRIIGRGWGCPERLPFTGERPTEWRCRSSRGSAGPSATASPPPKGGTKIARANGTTLCPCSKGCA